MYANMRQCDSKYLQNARKMCFWRDSQYSMLRGEQSSSFTNSISMTLVQKREKDERCVLTCEKSERKEGAIEQFLDLGLAATLKT